MPPEATMPTRPLLVLIFMLLPVSLGITQITANQSMPTGGELLSDCTQALKVIDGDSLSDVEYANAAHCNGYLLGVVDGYTVTEASEKSRIHFTSSMICLPSNGTASTSQLVPLVVKYLRRNSAHSRESAASLILQAMQESFPCK
jgi:hypothetical protein